jgi:hypothetical protein
MQLPLIRGIKGTSRADFEAAYPVNLEPVYEPNGISDGHVRSAMGANALATGPGVDRGSIIWSGTHYRVMGTKLVSVSGSTITTLGDVGGSGPVSLERFDSYLAIRSGAALWYWNGSALTHVTDSDLGACVDIARLNGQLFSTDGTYIIAAQLADPTQFETEKYGGAESDPDGIVGLMRLRNELYALGQSTIDVLSYVGGEGFPLQLNEGATIPIGVCGTMAAVRYLQTFAFVGAGEKQGLAVWLAQGGTADKISTRAIDDLLAEVEDPSSIQLEQRSSRDEARLYVHLPDKSLVYLRAASSAAQSPVWYIARSGLGAGKAYRLRNAALVGGQFIVGDTETAQLGIATEGPVTTDTPNAFMSMSADGETWGLERAAPLGKQGARFTRTQWRPHRKVTNYLGLKFRGETGLPHFGEAASWEMRTQLIYVRGILHKAELVGLPGRGVQAFAACEVEVEKLA